MTGVFPSVLKTAKVVTVFKKDSKLDYSNYRPISPLSNIEQIFEKRMYKRIYNFLYNNNIIYNLQFRFIQQYSTQKGFYTKKLLELLIFNQAIPIPVPYSSKVLS